MSDPFSKFVNFGLIGDNISRKQFADDIFNQLLNGSFEGKDFSTEQLDIYNFAVKQIISNPSLQELCQQNRELSEKITKDILEFISKSGKEILKSENPFQAEMDLLDEFKNSTKKNHRKVWRNVKSEILAIYSKSEIDIKYYDRLFRQNEKEIGNNPDILRFDSIKESVIEQWSTLVFKKTSQWELQLIDEARKKFVEELYMHIENLKKLIEIILPFSSALGRLWDLSKGNWQKVNFNLLRQFAELVEKEGSIKELAEILGRTRQAEKEYEEELIQTIELKPHWEVNYAGKSELVGIKESDELGNMLPSEAALLADKSIEPLFYKKYAEKKLLTFDYQSKELKLKEEEIAKNRLKEKDVQKGPFIICVDTSGSMHGTPENIAKVLCFAILKIAIRDNRKCYLISFSTEIQTLNLADLKGSLEQLVSFLSMSFYGGTDALPAMREALNMLETNDFKKADVIMVSDFILPAMDLSVTNMINQAKEKKTRFHSLVIGNSKNNQVVSLFDNTWIYNTGAQGSMLQLVKNLNETF